VFTSEHIYTYGAVWHRVYVNLPYSERLRKSWYMLCTGSYFRPTQHSCSSDFNHAWQKLAPSFPSQLIYPKKKAFYLELITIGCRVEGLVNYAIWYCGHFIQSITFGICWSDYAWLCARVVSLLRGNRSLTSSFIPSLYARPLRHFS
jgi:hypothetical protein